SSLVSSAASPSLPYTTLFRSVQERGETFVSPGDDVYSGMVVGEHNRPSDLDVNPCRAKKVTNMRASGHDEAVRLIPPKRRSLEEIGRHTSELQSRENLVCRLL